MKKIIKLTEQEFKNIIENSILNEQDNYNVFKDPKARALIDFLMETETEEEFTLSQLKLSKYDYYGMNLYKVDDYKEYAVGTDEEADIAYSDYMRSLIDDLGIEAFNENFIMNYVESEWFENALREYYENYIIDIRSEKSSDPDKWRNRLEEEMAENNSENEEEFLEKIIYDAGDPVEYFKSNFGDKEFITVVNDNNLIDMDKLIEASKESNGRGNYLSGYDGEEHYFEGYYIYRVN